MDDLKHKLEKIVEHFRQESGSLRTGRATPTLVEELPVDYYGTKTPLKAIATISCPGPRELVIQPWDKDVLPAIESAIQSSSLGLAPIADRDTVRLSIPPLNEERRRELVKLLHRHLEDARIHMRREREDALRDIDRRHKAKEISEDARFRERAEIQKIVDDANKKVEDGSAAKEKEIMTV